MKTLDNAQRTLMVDESKTVKQLMEIIFSRIGMDSNREYCLAILGNSESEGDTLEMSERNAKKMQAIKSALHTEDDCK